MVRALALTIRKATTPVNAPDPTVWSDEQIKKSLRVIADLVAMTTTEKPQGMPVTDMSDRFPAGSSLLRVELRRCKPPVIEGKSYGRTVEKDYIIGLMHESQLPKKGGAFQIHYHNYSGSLTFNCVESGELITRAIREGNDIFFSAVQVDWRLRILPAGDFAY